MNYALWIESILCEKKEKMEVLWKFLLFLCGLFYIFSIYLQINNFFNLKQTRMKRKTYKKPVMQVFRLHQKIQLLNGSPQGNLGGSQPPQEENWGYDD